MKKTWISALGVFVLAVLFGLMAYAEPRTSGLYTYEFKGNGTLRIIDFDWVGNKGEDIYIP